MHYKNNMTALRLFSAGLVLYGHSFIFLGLDTPIFMNWVPIGTLGVYIFFSISGYLIAQSWENDPNVVRFMKRRALRIFPGLIGCTIICAFILGPILSNLKLVNYLSNPSTINYLYNTVLYITFFLPGVFEKNHIANVVNGSLWSLPVEFSMYIFLALIGLMRIPKIGWFLFTLTIITTSKLWALNTSEMLVFYRTDLRQLAICGAYFWTGAVFYRYNIKKIITMTSTLGAAALWIFLSYWPNIFSIASWFMLPFLSLAFGLKNNSSLNRLTPYDYSYGIYIYAFPIQQTIVKIWPTISLSNYIITSAFATLITASISWSLIEKPALKLKPKFQKIID
jgi:peptidoglycan/LPS O-acetylase OafA/YrhL